MNNETQLLSTALAHQIAHRLASLCYFCEYTRDSETTIVVAGIDDEDGKRHDEWSLVFKLDTNELFFDTKDAHYMRRNVTEDVLAHYGEVDVARVVELVNEFYTAQQFAHDASDEELVDEIARLKSATVERQSTRSRLDELEAELVVRANPSLMSDERLDHEIAMTDSALGSYSLADEDDRDDDHDETIAKLAAELNELKSESSRRADASKHATLSSTLAEARLSLLNARSVSAALMVALPLDDGLAKLAHETVELLEEFSARVASRHAELAANETRPTTEVDERESAHEEEFDELAQPTRSAELSQRLDSADRFDTLLDALESRCDDAAALGDSRDFNALLSFVSDVDAYVRFRRRAASDRLSGDIALALTSESDAEQSMRELTKGAAKLVE